MNEEISITPIVVGALAVLYVGYEIERRRHQLRETFNVFDKKESTIAQALELHGGERPAQAVRARVKPRRGRPVDRANPTTRYWTNPVNASATNRQPEPTTDQDQSPPPLPEGVS